MDDGFCGYPWISADLVDVDWVVDGLDAGMDVDVDVDMDGCAQTRRLEMGEGNKTTGEKS